VFEYFKLFATEDKLAVMDKRFAEGISWADVKKELFEAVNGYLKPMRDKYDYYMAHFDEVEQMLQKGEERARVIARETIERVKKSVGVI
jgi:tryptophanyl-tRNA synthetase